MSSFTIEIAEHKAPPRLIQIDPFQISGSMQVHTAFCLAFPPWWILYYLCFIVRLYLRLKLEMVLAARTLSLFNLHIIIQIQDSVIIVAIVSHQTRLDAYKAIQPGKLTYSFSNKSSMRNQHVNSFIHEFFTRDSLKPNEKILLEYHSDNASGYLLEN